VALTSRAFDAARGDLRRMQRLVQDAWRAVGPKNERHVGDVAWAHAHIPGRQDTFRRRLWEADGRVVAYAWLFRPQTLDWQVAPDRPELVDAVLEWFEAEAEADALETSALADDEAGIAVLGARGYAEVTDGPWLALTIRDLEQIEEPRLPPRYTLRTIAGDADLERRVEIHRAAWEPSRFTLESYLDVRATWPYREDLDCVVEAADGSFVGYVLAWYDDENRVGEFEPVGTHPDHRRLGLGRAVNLYALQRLRAVGAEHAVVMCRGDDAYPIPKRLYESVGFRQHGRIVNFAKTR
jgi:ribosomal protein S18 acetylase RimI-like enzyme